MTLDKAMDGSFGRSNECREDKSVSIVSVSLFIFFLAHHVLSQFSFLKLCLIINTAD